MPVPDFTPDNTPPVAIALPSLAGTGDDATPVTPGAFTPDNTSPVAIAIGTFTPDNTPAEAKDPADTTPAYSRMPSTFTPAFVELTGGASSLDTLQPTVADVGKILQGTVDGELKSYQVRAGTDATDLPGIVRGANFDAIDNAIIFVQV